MAYDEKILDFHSAQSLGQDFVYGECMLFMRCIRLQGRCGVRPLDPGWMEDKAGKAINVHWEVQLLET